MRLIFIALSIFLSISHAQQISNYQSQVAQFYQLKPEQNLLILPIKGYQQTADFSCGPAAVMSLLHFYGKLTDKQMNHATEMRIAKEMGTSSQRGTSPQQIVAWLNQHHFKAEYHQQGTMSLISENLKKGIPTLIEWIDWGGHWVVATGYFHGGPSQDHDLILLADPAVHFNQVKSIHGLTVFDASRFESMWFDAQYFDPGHLVKGIYITAVPVN